VSQWVWEGGGRVGWEDPYWVKCKIGNGVPVRSMGSGCWVLLLDIPYLAGQMDKERGYHLTLILTYKFSMTYIVIILSSLNLKFPRYFIELI
jgi:hypothetical protein